VRLAWLCRRSAEPLRSRAAGPNGRRNERCSTQHHKYEENNHVPAVEAQKALLWIENLSELVPSEGSGALWDHASTSDL